jgi:hypothetical protein
MDYFVDSCQVKRTNSGREKWKHYYYYYYYYYYYSIKSSRADSRIKVWKFSEVSGTDCDPIFRVMLMAGKTKTDDLVTCYAYCILGHQFIGLGFTRHQHHPEDGDAVSP